MIGQIAQPDVIGDPKQAKEPRGSGIWEPMSFLSTIFSPLKTQSPDQEARENSLGPQESSLDLKTALSVARLASLRVWGVGLQ